MPVNFLNNYPESNLEAHILNSDGKPLQGEIWLYRQFLQFNENNLLPEETWHLKHNYNLSTHPACKNKIEGQVDFLVLTKHGLLVIEVKGGGLRVDENDCYYSYNQEGEYQSQNPFIQVKEYAHTLKKLNEKSNLFIYRAVVLPFEAGFELKGPQLSGYKQIFYSKRDYLYLESDIAINHSFFGFISDLGKKARRNNIKELFPSINHDDINKRLFQVYPELSSKDLRRVKSELFPVISSYGYNPVRINSELILKENYDILKGLRRNIKVMVQGAPGTGKTVLAQKFLAENLLKQHKGIFFCANNLVRAKLEHIIINEYQLDPNYIQFRIFSSSVTQESIPNDIDFFVFDEAQEYFDKGLYDMITELDKKLDIPKILVLYDPEQSIINDFKDLDWYTDYFIKTGYSHYYFDEMYRCIQDCEIAKISSLIHNNFFSRVESDFHNCLTKCDGDVEKMELLGKIINETRFHSNEKIILIQNTILDEFRIIVKNYFKSNFEELTEHNINIPSAKIRFTTPLKYRGLENKCVYIVTSGINEKSKVQNYVGATRAMELLNFIVW